MRFRHSHSAGLLSLLTVSVLAELLLLRTATRTLIHIPGLARFDEPITVLAEVGRFAYFLAVVSLLATLVLLARSGLRLTAQRRRAAGIAVLAFLAVAAAGRIDAVPWPVVGWLSLILVPVAGLAVWRGRHSVPVGLFLLGFVASGASVLGQGAGGGLTGGQVDLLVWISEWCVVLSGLTAPLLLEKAPSRVALAVGALSAATVAAAFSAGASTLSILVLWNIGVPGWMPAIAYAIALGGIVTTLWNAIGRGDRSVAFGVILLIGGGIGMISTYQTGLVLAAVLILGDVPLTAVRSEADRMQRAPETGIALQREPLGVA
jgi:hypothetical protein